MKSMYKDLTKVVGVNYFPKSWTIIPSKEENYFPNPFNPRQFRYRSLFQNGSHYCLVVYIYLTDQEIGMLKFFNVLPGQIYLYGAFNQLDVYQMRALGVIKEVKGDERGEIICFMKERFDGKNICFDSFFPVKVEQKEKEEGINSLKLPGKLYSFEPISYAYSEYERN